MFSSRLKRLGGLALFAMALVVPGTASGAAAGTTSDQIYSVYQVAGSIPSCAFTHQALLDALKSIPADIAAYDPGFGQALSETLLAPSGPGCSSGLTAPGETVPSAPGDGLVLAEDGSPGPSSPKVHPGLPIDLTPAEASLPIPLLLAIATLLGLMAMTTFSALGVRPRQRSSLRRRAAWDPITSAREWLLDVLWIFRHRIRD